MNKRGFAVSQIPSLAITLGLIAIVIAVVATMLVSFQDSQLDADEGRTTASLVDQNDTFVVSNTTAVDIAADHSGSHLFVDNQCSNVKIYGIAAVDMTANFTISGCTAILLTADDSFYNAKTMTANYTYQFYEYGYVYNITQEGIDSQTDLAQWQTTWVVVIAAAIIIGIIAAYLMFKPRE